MDGPGGASVSLDAVTDNDDRGATTGADSKKDDFGQFAINSIQDGEYKLTTPNTADNSFGPKGGYELEVYHNEGMDDGNDATDYVGKAFTKDDAKFTATKLRLSIKGFVANDTGDGRLRGNEAMAGVTVNLMKQADAKDTAYTVVHMTDETNDDGMYEFNELPEGARYRVAVPGGDDYAGLRALDAAEGTEVGSYTMAVMGRNQYSTGNDFHVYSGRAGTAAGLTSAIVSGMGDDGAVADTVETPNDANTVSDVDINDADYTISGATRANPVGHAPTAITVNTANVNVTANMSHDLDDAEATSVALHIDRNTGAECAQSIVSVMAGGTNLTGSDGATDDCSGEQYTVTLSSTNSTVVRITMKSEDGVESTYQLTINKT